MSSVVIEARAINPPDLSRLLEVSETRHPLGNLHPIWVRHGTNECGPCVAHPERHPYCEISLACAGEGSFSVENEQAKFRARDILLVGTGLPHWGEISRYPYRFITVYFLPSVLIELDPERDGPRILRRFTARQSLANRIIRPSRELGRHLVPLFEQIVSEFEGKEFGREIRLRTLLMELLVSLLRWEHRHGRSGSVAPMDVDWQPIFRVLDYLRQNYTEPIYASKLAQASGMSESRLKILFRRALGMSWVKYLQGYRIHRAAALLSQPGSNVTEAAFAVGFESLSHFNSVFRSFLGVSPTVYVKNASGQDFNRDSTKDKPPLMSRPPLPINTGQ